MPIFQVNNIFTPEELEILKNEISQRPIEIDENLGRKHLGDLTNVFTPAMDKKLCDIAKDATVFPLKMVHALCTTYSAKYGQPNLPPHFDGDTNDLIINMQIDSNISWDLGLNTDIYSIEDNSAIVFNGNTEVHWRPHKEFKEDEYITMMFVRFYNEENPSDYSYLPMNQTDPIFDDARRVRDSII